MSFSLRSFARDTQREQTFGENVLGCLPIICFALSCRSESVLPTHLLLSGLDGLVPLLALHHHVEAGNDVNIDQLAKTMRDLHLRLLRQTDGDGDTDDGLREVIVMEVVAVMAVVFMLVVVL